GAALLVVVGDALAPPVAVGVLGAAHEAAAPVLVDRVAHAVAVHVLPVTDDLPARVVGRPGVGLAVTVGVGAAAREHAVLVRAPRVDLAVAVRVLVDARDGHAVGFVVDGALGPPIAVLVEQLALAAVADVHPAVGTAVAVAVLHLVGRRRARRGCGLAGRVRAGAGRRGGAAQRLELGGDRERGAGARVGLAAGQTARGLLLAQLLLHRLLLGLLGGELRLLRAVVFARERNAGLVLDALVGALAE